MKIFVGRDAEIRKMKELNSSFTQKGMASLVVIKGRRRIGKSRLAQEYAKNQRFISFSGMAPIEPVTAQDQRNAFASQLTQQFHLPPLTFLDWSDAFLHLTHHLTNKPTVILLDEISWMGSEDPTFVPKLKIWWDLHLQYRPHLMVIFCGSVSTWIEENILNSTAFFGRVSLTMDLPPLSLPASAQFLRALGYKGSVYDTYKLLAVTGGIPWYLEQIFANDLADANIKRLCFSKGGLLTTEFDRIFHDLFHNKSPLYKALVLELAQGMKSLPELQKATGYASSGTFSEVVEHLITSGFISCHYQWSLKSGKPSKSNLYRLSDPYIRFYIKYIEPNRQKIEQNSFEGMTLQELPGWEAMIGFQVESLLLQNRPLLLKSMNISPADIVGDNPYIQKPTTRQKGCQIDYLVQTHSHNLFVCEFKFTRRELDSAIIQEMQEKIKHFSVPRGFGTAPVLIHLGGVSDRVHEACYFFRIIDCADLLEM